MRSLLSIPSKYIEIEVKHQRTSEVDRNFVDSFHWMNVNILLIIIYKLFDYRNIFYRWLFLRKEQKSLPKLTSENLKYLISWATSQWLKIFCVQKSVPCLSKGKIALWNEFHYEISRISNFQMWVWGVIFVTVSEKVTCT